MNLTDLAVGAWIGFLFAVTTGSTDIPATGESYGFVPYRDTEAEKIAQREDAKHAARVAHRVDCAMGILARGVGAAPRARVNKAPSAMARRGVATAQDLGSCLPWPASRVAAGRTKGVRGNDAPRLSSRPAGVPGGSGSRGAASEVA